MSMIGMKVAFVTDTHFGYAKFEQDAYAQGRDAILDAASNADALILGGDIFDHRIPKLETVLEVSSVLKEAAAIMEKKGCPVAIFGIHGTHERRSKDALNPFALMAKMGLVVDVHNKTILLEKNSQKVAISGLGGIPDDLVPEALKRLDCKPIEGATNFFVFHQTLAEYVPQKAGLACIDDLPQGYDYYLCGHFHAKKEYMGGKLLLSGSTIMTQMREEEIEPKGYYLIDTQAKKAEFVEIQTRPYVFSQLEFERAMPNDIRQAVERKITELVCQKYKDKPILKIRLKGSAATGAGEIDLSGLESEEAFVVIDNQIEGLGLAAELERLKSDRMNRASPAELGASLLAQNAKAAGMDEKRAREYFEQFTKDE